MKDYKSWSNFDINKAVAEAKSMTTEHETGVSEYTDSPDGFMIVKQSDLIYYPFDPVNDVSHAHPIIVENKIGGHYGKATPDLYFAVSRDERHIAVDVNPLRAKMIVFLTMTEEVL